MSLASRFVASFALVCWAGPAVADGIEPGLWKITSQIESNGVLRPPQQSAKCLTPEETRDLATTFSPLSRTINSECAPIERSLVGTRLTWKLVCKGQLDMELTGDFNFHDPHHYTATVQTKSAMAGMVTVQSLHKLEAEWVSECR